MPGDVELAAEIEDEQGIVAGTSAYEHPSDVRARAMLQADTSHSRAGTPRETWRTWRAYGRRHGVEHPGQTADRVGQHQAEQAARKDRAKAKAVASGPHDRFDARTTGNVAARASESRRLNQRHVDRPPIHDPQTYDFELPEQVDGSFYRQGRAPGQQARHSAYSWDLETGFRY
ncbi:MAG: hypothetical protein ACRDRJ_05080 [Streptosporangiaceae bacterium]